MPDPMYRRIAEDLRQKIESGELGHGTQLPTELELRDRYDASRNTVRDAVRWLITRGLVETRPGQGTFVVDKIDPFITTLTAELETGLGGEGAAYASEVTARSRRPTVTVPRVEIQQAAGVIARELRLDDGSTVVSRHQQRLIDGTAYSLQTTFYPMRLVEQGAPLLIQAQDMPAGTVRYLEETLGIKQVGCRDTITVRAPDATEAAFFKLADDGRIAVFEIFQTGFDERGRPMRLTVSVYPTDRNQFAINVGQVPDEVTEPRSVTEAGVPLAETAELGGSG
ncbi:MAG TPA: GntR family transcriptional regulator [Streptosporangiaceae bacterium]|nr:GntR family transcriptional regulator [Streptosporangiaceae bacterium]